MTQEMAKREEDRETELDEANAAHLIRLKAIVDQFEIHAAVTTAKMEENTAMALKLDEQYADKQSQLKIAFEQAAKR